MAEVTFCDECNNILYARSNPEKKELVYVCRSCDFVFHKRDEKSNVVARINYNYNRKEDVYIHPETKNDPALGRVRDWKCKQCGNEEAVFLQLPEKISYNPMALIYVCTNMKCEYWEKEAQQSLESIIYASDEEENSVEAEGSILFSVKENENNNLKSEDNRLKEEMIETEWRDGIDSEHSKDSIISESRNKMQDEQPNNNMEGMSSIALNKRKEKITEENLKEEKEVEPECEEDSSDDVDVEEFFQE